MHRYQPGHFSRCNGGLQQMAGEDPASSKRRGGNDCAVSYFMTPQ
jgi:hypothetical protein